MQTPNEAAVKELRALGMEVTHAVPFDKLEGNRLGVVVEVGLADTVQIDVPDTFNVSVVNRRGVVTVFSDFGLINRDNQRILTFKTSIRSPDGADPSLWAPEGLSLLGTSFVDLCWFQGNEAIPEGYEPTLVTKPNPEAVMADLGWFLPSRFIDPFVSAMGKLNEVFFAGVLEDAMLYGTLIKKESC